MNQGRRRIALFFLGGCALVVTLSASLAALALASASAQEPTPEAQATADAGAPADVTATPVSEEPSPACSNERLSLEKLQNSETAKGAVALSSMTLSELANGDIKVEAAGRELVIQGGGEAISILVPPGTPDELVTEITLAIDEVRYAC